MISPAPSLSVSPFNDRPQNCTTQEEEQEGDQTLDFRLVDRQLKLLCVTKSSSSVNVGEFSLGQLSEPHFYVISAFKRIMYTSPLMFELLYRSSPLRGCCDLATQGAGPISDRKKPKNKQEVEREFL